MYKIQELISSTAANDLMVEATPAGLEDFYHSLDLTLTHSMLPEDFEAHAPPAPQASDPLASETTEYAKSDASAMQSHSRKLQGIPGLSTILTDLSSSISTLGAFVDSAAAAANVAYQTFTNQVDLVNSINVTQLDFNYNPTTKGPQCAFSLADNFAAEKKLNKISNTASGDVKANMAGSCSNCFAHLGLTLDVRAKVVQGSVQNVSVVLSGSAQFQTTFDITFNGAAQLDLKHLLATLKPPPLKFVIGAVPMVLGVTVPIYVGLNASVTAKAQISGDMGAIANVRAGVQIAPDANRALQPTFINQLSFSRSGSGLTLQSGSADAAVRLYLLPVPATNIDYIGGPTLGLRTYFEGIMNVDTKQCPPSLRALRSNIGVEGTIGADLHVLTFKRKINSLATFSQHDTIKPAACSGSQQGRKLLTSLSDPWALVGNVWSGQQIYTGYGRRCNAANYSPVIIASLQLIEVVAGGTGGILTMLATINSGTPSLGAAPYTQLTQQLYYLSYYNSGDVSFTATGSNANFLGTQPGVPSNIVFLEPAYGLISSDGKTITLQDTLLCTSGVYTLSKPSNTTGSPAKAASTTSCPWYTAQSSESQGMQAISLFSNTSTLWLRLANAVLQHIYLHDIKLQTGII